MDYFDLYKSRLKAYGNSQDETYINTTKYSINRTFDNSPFSTVIKFNNVDTDVIINQGTTSSEKIILLRPDVQIEIGSTTEIDGNAYLVIDSDKNKLYPVLKLMACNSTIQLSGSQNVTVVEDPLWGQTEQVTYSNPVTIPCIVETKVRTDNSTEAINLPLGQVIITIKYMEHDDLDINKQLAVLGDNYRINGFDKSKQGLLIIYGEKV